jgi:hypothetical protein
MTERLVDVSNSSKTAVIHIYPITIGGSDIDARDAEYEEKALKAAAYAQLIPDADLKDLTTRMHVSRGGALEPYGVIETCFPKRSRASTRLSRARPTSFGSRRAAPKVGPTNFGIALMTNAFARVPTCFGNKRAARKVGLTNTGTGPVNLRRTDPATLGEHHRLPKRPRYRSAPPCRIARYPRSPSGGVGRVARVQMPRAHRSWGDRGFESCSLQ